MSIATALVAGDEALPQLAETTVRQTLEKAGLTHASGILLFLTPDFARHAQQAVTAAARAAQCTQVAGGIAAGVFTESGWVLDRPAAAVMVFGNGLALGHPQASGEAGEPVLSYGGSTFAADWQQGAPRFGGNFTGTVGYADPVVWQQGRLAENKGCSIQLLGARTRVGLSTGLRLLGDPQRIESSSGYDLESLGGLAARESLQRALPPEYRKHSPLPLHLLSAVLIDDENCRSSEDARAAVADGRSSPLAIIALNPDRSLTLAERTFPGQKLAWAIRQPLSAEADMRQTLERLAAVTPEPDAALLFSCIGRGPYFYGCEDRDLDALRERFPGLPLLGTYSTGQIAPGSGAGQRINRSLQNAAVAALITGNPKEAHVQSIT
ncbi:MAG: FIST C-terminal domain-containing protein [Rhodocyclaceae bacterium]